MSVTEVGHRPVASLGPDAIRARRVVSVTLLTGLFVAILLGRFSLGRLGDDRYANVDLRFFAIGGLVAATVIWRFLPVAHHWRVSWALSTRLVLLLLGYLALTVLWAPVGAQVVDSTSDLLFVAVLIVLTVVISAPDPARARRVVIICLWVAGSIYGAAGLLIGQTDAQGRTVAFGGGPNIYVRVIVLGAIAAIALSVLYRRWFFLLPIPGLAASAVLSGSRGGLLAAVLTAGLFLALYRRRVTARAVLILVIGGSVSLAGAAWFIFGSRAASKLRDRFVTDLFVTHQYSERPQLASQGLSLLLRHPWTGAGLDSFYVVFGQRENLRYPHNMLIEVGSDGGLIGLLLLAAIVVVFCYEGRPWRPMSADRITMALGAFYIAVASMFTGDVYDTRLLWIFAALAMTPMARFERLHGCCPYPPLMTPSSRTLEEIGSTPR
jgi:O-antigen ligase